MGSNFFHGSKPSVGAAPKIGNISGGNLFARSIAAPGYSARSFGGAANKDVGMASAVANVGGFKKSQRNSAYAPGPKRV